MKIVRRDQNSTATAQRRDSPGHELQPSHGTQMEIGG